MAKPVLKSWKDGEKVTPTMMKERITDPQGFYGMKPYFAAQGCEGTSVQGSYRGMALDRGKFHDIKCSPSRVGRNGFTVKADNVGVIVPEDGVYHLHARISAYGSEIPSTGTNVYVAIEAANASTGGASGSLAYTGGQLMLSNYSHTVSATATEFLTRGTALKVVVYLDSAASGKWLVSSEAFDTGFYGFMLCPGAASWGAQAPGPGPDLRRWADGDLLNAEIMNGQTVKQFLPLENFPRIEGKGPSFTSAGYTSVTQVSWPVKNSNSKSLTFDGSTVTIPWDGLYLVSATGTVEHDKKSTSNPQATYQLILHAGRAGQSGGESVYLTQGGNSKKGYSQGSSGQIISDVLYLRAGTQLSVRFWGSYYTSKWTARIDPSSDKRSRKWWNFAVTYVGRG